MYLRKINNINNLVFFSLIFEFYDTHFLLNYVGITWLTKRIIFNLIVIYNLKIGYMINLFSNLCSYTYTRYLGIAFDNFHLIFFDKC